MKKTIVENKTTLATHSNAILNEAFPTEVLNSIVDPQRYSPMLAGGSCIRVQGKRSLLIVRAPGEDIEVQAPPDLLQSVFDTCDGTRTIHEILASIAQADVRSEFSDFIDFLIGEGALIDASLAAVQALRYGFQFSPFGLAANSEVTDKISRRFLWNKERAPGDLADKPVKITNAPLDVFFENRVTTYTFDDKSISQNVLHQLLWSLAGVVRVKHPRTGLVAPQRTLASAGAMHLLEVYVALLRSVENYSAGIYRVHYPDERAILLERISDEHHLTPLAFGKPWDLTYATGAIFLAADPVIGAMRYRSRSLQYLFMEAGAALHNGALSAAALQLGYATIGGFYERPVARLCQLENKLALGTAIFGAAPSAEQIELLARSPDIDFAWVNGESARFTMGFYLARAKVKSDDRDHTWGRGVDPKMAMIKAIAEAVEREGCREPRRIVEGTFAEVENAMDPRQFIQYHATQFFADDFPYKPFDEHAVYPWTEADDIVTGAKAHVLAELVFTRDSLARLAYATPRPYAQITSSGCAASTTYSDAIYRAMLEVIERDAFVRCWLAQKPGTLVALEKLPKDIALRIQRLTAAGCIVTTQLLPSAWAHVALVSAQSQSQHFTTMATAANADFVLAIDNALDELEARVYAWVHGHRPSIQLPSEVMTAEHHFELYGLKRYYKKADRVLFPNNAQALDGLPKTLAFSTLETLTKHFVSRGIHPFAVNITPKNSYIDQGRTKLEVAKVLIPGLLPISFGYQREPLGMVPRIHSGAKFPHPFP